MHQETDELCGVEAIRRDWIESLLRNLQRDIDVDELYVFGSRAENEHLTWSDYDVCVISNRFRSLPLWKRMELVLECWEGQRALEPVCFTPQEFQQGDSALVGEIRRRGIRVYPGPKIASEDHHLEISSEDGPTHSEDGVDLTLIRWMLSMTPAERLETLQQHIHSTLRLLGEESHT